MKLQAFSQFLKKATPWTLEIITNCSNLAKVMEYILNHELMKYLDDNSSKPSIRFQEKSLHR